MRWINAEVICFIVCVVKCFGMSKDEIEDFADHLDKTSKLDVILKKGNPEHDYDEDEPLSDHAWEESGKFEGDLILNDRQRKLLVENVAEGLSRNGLRDGTKRWPNNEVVYYIQKEHFSDDQVQAIQSGIDDLAQASCIKFRPYRKGDRDAVVIQGSRRGCFSQVGYQGGYQVLNLSHRHPVGRGCFRHGTVVHELLHTLGFYHMQSSPDRDDYIDVVWENIIEPARHNFRKYNTFSVTDFGVGYDYDSVLHYSRRAFSANGRDTLVPKQNGASIGQRHGLSDKDSQKLNKMYCDADSDNHNEEEDTKQKPIKKKTPKNKPFDGHGIGYHQGKTVVIKLNPEAKTFKITKNIPRFHVLDNFSKTPQVLSPTEKVGPGKEINYSYTSPSYSEEYQKMIESFTYDKINDTGILPENKVHLEEQPPAVVLNQNNIKSNGKFNINVSMDTSSQDYEEPNLSDNTSESWNEEFDRLGKIIKTHVYPSQTPNLDVYKIKTDYTEFYNPISSIAPNDENQKLDKAFYSKAPLIASEDDNKNSYLTDKKQTLTFIQNLFTTSTPEKDENPQYQHNENINKHLDFSSNSQSNDEQSSKEDDTISKSNYHPFYKNYEDTTRKINLPYDISQFHEDYKDKDQRTLEQTNNSFEEDAHGEKVSAALITDNAFYKQHKNNNDENNLTVRDKTEDFEKDVHKPAPFSLKNLYNGENLFREMTLIDKPPQFYEEYKEKEDKNLANVYSLLKEVGDKTQEYKQEKNINSEPHATEPSSEEVESTFGTTYPLRQMHKVMNHMFETPQYATLPNLQNKNDYTSLNNPEKGNNDSNAKGKYTLLGHAVPFEQKWYNIEDEQNSNEKYKKSSYTYPSDVNIDDKTQKVQIKSDSNTVQIHGKLPSGKEAYHLFGVLVPLSEDWFKVDYDPHKGAYSIEKQRSNNENT